MLVNTNLKLLEILSLSLCALVQQNGKKFYCACFTNIVRGSESLVKSSQDDYESEHKLSTIRHYVKATN